jgi:hypothetical protein
LGLSLAVMALGVILLVFAFISMGDQFYALFDFGVFFTVGGVAILVAEEIEEKHQEQSD